MQSIITYVFLVGIPLAGLVGILKLGEQLDAPRPIAGNWVAVEAESRAAWDEGCRTGEHLDATTQGPSQIRIEQSGGRVDVTWSGVRAKDFRLSLRGDSLNGKLVLESGGDCKGGELMMSGVVSQAESRARITGELRKEDCSNCEPIPIDWRKRR
jgi:hypothetical protein